MRFARHDNISFQPGSPTASVLLQMHIKDDIGDWKPRCIGGCHGDDERQVFDELCEIVEETIRLYHEDGKPLPAPTAGRDFVNAV